MANVMTMSMGMSVSVMMAGLVPTVTAVSKVIVMLSEYSMKIQCRILDVLERLNYFYVQFFNTAHYRLVLFYTKRNDKLIVNNLKFLAFKVLCLSKF